MLRISKLADYATIVMVYLAQNLNRLCNARDIAAKTHLAVPTVSKILKQLTSAKLLVSVRGVAGGYKLIKDAKDITVVDILFALDQDKGLIECHHQKHDCSLSQVCNLKNNWRMISQAIEAALMSVSLETLAQPVLSQEQVKRMQELAMGVKRGE